MINDKKRLAIMMTNLLDIVVAFIRYFHVSACVHKLMLWNPTRLYGLYVGKFRLTPSDIIRDYDVHLIVILISAAKVIKINDIIMLLTLFISKP